MIIERVFLESRTLKEFQDGMLLDLSLVIIGTLFIIVWCLLKILPQRTVIEKRDGRYSEDR